MNINDEYKTTTTYKLPAHWASALLYGDETGLSDDEAAEINHFLFTHPDQWCVDVEFGEPEFTENHDAQAQGVLPCDCLVFTFQLAEANEEI